jgi:beta-phosphoglucomutase
MAAPKAVLFDLDGVIVDSEAIHHRAYEAALAPLGIERIPFEVYAREWSNRNTWVEYLTRTHPGIDVAGVRRRKADAFRDLFRREARLRPGAAEAVSALARCWPLALATGTARAEAEFVLERYGLARWFRAVVGREDYGADKPAPDAFLAAARRLDTAPADCVAIEDSYKGLCAARAAGIRCVIVPNDYTRGADFGGAAALLSSMREVSVETIAALDGDRG